MSRRTPPARIAHAYGNRRETLQRALAAPIDMIEADVWFRAGRIWVHHERRMGPLRLLLDRRTAGHPSGPYVLPIWPRYYIRLDINPLPLSELLEITRGKRRLLLDVKGRPDDAKNDAFAAALARQLAAPDDRAQVVVCGQNWPVLDRLRELAPDLEVRYSIEKPPQWQEFHRMVAADDSIRHICIEHRFLTEEKARFLAEKGIDAYCWTVDDPAEAERLLAAEVGGIISNNLPLLASLGSSSAAGS